MALKVKLTDFTIKVIEVIQSIPRGKVATYQQVAELSGKPHASRGVSWILNSCAKKYKLPWQRVISKSGKIAFKRDTYYFKKQRRLLMAEGISVDALTGEINMKQFQMKRKARTAKKVTSREPRMFD